MFQKTKEVLDAPASATLFRHVRIIYQSIRPKAEDIFLYKESIERLPFQGWELIEKNMFTKSIADYLASWSYLDSYKVDFEGRKKYCNDLRDTPDKNDLYRLFRKNKLRHGNITNLCTAVSMLFPKLKESAQALCAALSDRKKYEDLSYDQKLVFVEEATQLARVACSSLRKR